MCSEKNPYFFDRGKGNGFLGMKTFHTVYNFVHFWNKLA